MEIALPTREDGKENRLEIKFEVHGGGSISILDENGQEIGNVELDPLQLETLGKVLLGHVSSCKMTKFAQRAKLVKQIESLKLQKKELEKKHGDLWQENMKLSAQKRALQVSFEELGKVIERLRIDQKA
jgi:hypothetical protein